MVSSSTFSLGLLFSLYTYYSQKHVFSIFSKDSEDIANLREGHFQENTTITAKDYNTQTFKFIYSEFNSNILITRIRWSLTSSIICLSFYWSPLPSPSHSWLSFPLTIFSLPFLLSDNLFNTQFPLISIYTLYVLLGQINSGVPFQYIIKKILPNRKRFEKSCYMNSPWL